MFFNYHYVSYYQRGLIVLFGVIIWCFKVNDDADLDIIYSNGFLIETGIQ